MAELLAVIINRLADWIITTAIIAPPLWTIKTIYSLVMLQRKVVVSKQNADFCQKLHEVLERLIVTPQKRVLIDYASSLEADLQNRTYANARGRIGKEIENRLRPSIRKSMQEYEKALSSKRYRELKTGLSPVLFRPAISPFESLPLEYRYDFAKDCTQQLAWIHVFHCNEARDYIEKSPILRILPFSVKERLHR